MLPKYFSNIHLVVNSITGEISICSAKMINGKCITDKQKYVTDKFFNCILVHADHLPVGDFKYTVQPKDNGDDVGYLIYHSDGKNKLPEILRQCANVIEDYNKENN